MSDTKQFAYAYNPDECDKRSLEKRIAVELMVLLCVINFCFNIHQVKLNSFISNFGDQRNLL